MNTMTPKNCSEPAEFAEFIYRQGFNMAKERDRFIFSEFAEYLGQKFKVSEVHIPVELVERMFICFTTEHKDEFDALMAKFNGEVTK